MEMAKREKYININRRQRMNILMNLTELRRFLNNYLKRNRGKLLALQATDQYTNNRAERAILPVVTYHKG